MRRESGNTMRAGLGRVLPVLLAALPAIAPLRLPAQTQTPVFSGLVAAWASGHVARLVNPGLGFRYVPTFHMERPIGSAAGLSFEASLNVFGTADFPSGRENRTDARAKVYRGWARFATPRFEARVGLQKINFGSASLLRPLMWFDRIDPRDPLQITDGVTGLLLKYTFQNNTNVWLWGLTGGGDAKGWEIYPTAKKSPEFGGRLQLPIPRGEMGFTYHHRRLDPGRGPAALAGDGSAPEDRIGFDGKWDLGVGFWVEGTMIKASSPVLPFPYERALTVGADYTFDIGSGLRVLGEHFVLEDSRTAFGAGRKARFSALSLNTSVGLLDAVTGIFYYDWENRQFYRFLNWQRTYDRWSIYLIGFWNPQTFAIYRATSGGSSFAGKGIQVMVAFNY
jgi:hypothetical protein